MPLSAKALREKRAPLTKTIRQLADAAQEQAHTAEQAEQWAKVNADYNDLTRQIEAAERVEAVEAEQAKVYSDPRLGFITKPPTAGGDGATVEVTEAHRSLALQAWCTTQLGGVLSPQQAEACQITGLQPWQSELRMRLYSTHDMKRLQAAWNQAHPSRAVSAVADFRADLRNTFGSAGGFLQAPESMVRQLEVNMLAFGGMRGAAETIRTATGERMSWPTADDTSNTGAQLGENTTIGSSVDPTFGLVYWDAYKFSSKPILVPFELLQDSAFDLPGLIGGMFGERLGRITNTKYTTGNGNATPKGIVTAAATFSAASASAIAADDLIKLMHSVDPAYRQGAGFMMHDSILLLIRLLKDGTGQYLWQSGLQMGVPDRLLGAPVTNNQDMASSCSSGAKTVLYGQLSKYKIRTVGDFRMYRLQERYRDTDQDGFVAFIREDGNLLTAGTAPVKVLTH